MVTWHFSAHTRALRWRAHLRRPRRRHAAAGSRPAAVSCQRPEGPGRALPAGPGRFRHQPTNSDHFVRKKEIFHTTGLRRLAKRHAIRVRARPCGAAGAPEAVYESQNPCRHIRVNGVRRRTERSRALRWCRACKPPPRPVLCAPGRRGRRDANESRHSAVQIIANLHSQNLAESEGISRLLTESLRIFQNLAECRSARNRSHR